MAKFTKLNIGDSVASSGGRVWKKLSSMLQLSAPTLSLDGDTLTITDDSGLATSFDILVDGEVKGTATSATFDLSTLDLEEGTYSITVIAKADGYIDSAESEAVSYEVTSLIGTWTFHSFNAPEVDNVYIGSSTKHSNTAIGNSIKISYYGSSGLTDYYVQFQNTSGDASLPYYYGMIFKTDRFDISAKKTTGSTSYTLGGSYDTKKIEKIVITEDIFEHNLTIGNGFLTWLKANATKTA